MKRWPFMVATLATVACWLLLRGLPTPARALTTFLLVPLVGLSIAQARAIARLDIRSLPRTSLYMSSGVTLWVLAFLAISAAAWSGFSAGLLGLRPLRPDLIVTWTIFGIGAAALLSAVSKLLGWRESELLMHLLPESPSEKALFVMLSITAGITEEIVFRGFLISALGFAAGSALVATVLSSLVFGALHAYQSLSGALRAALLGFALAVPYLLTESIVPSMIAHAVIDIVGGLWLVRRFNDEPGGTTIDQI